MSPAKGFVYNKGLFLSHTKNNVILPRKKKPRIVIVAFLVSCYIDETILEKKIKCEQKIIKLLFDIYNVSTHTFADV